MRTGRRGDVTTAWPSAASVGARMIARRSASGHARSPSSATPTTRPARIVSGRPIPSRRAGIPSVRRSAFRSMRDASEKRTTASVASASVLTSMPVAAGSTRPSASTPTTSPAAVKTIGAVIHVPSIRPEMAAKPRRMTASVASCQCTRGASQRSERHVLEPERAAPPAQVRCRDARLGRGGRHRRGARAWITRGAVPRAGRDLGAALR